MPGDDEGGPGPAEPASVLAPPREHDEPLVDSALPVALAATRPRRGDEPHELHTWSFEPLRGKIVDVRASGFDYRGELVGADETELYLRTETRWVVLPLDRVTSVEPADQRPRPLGGPPPGFVEDGGEEG